MQRRLRLPGGRKCSIENAGQALCSVNGFSLVKPFSIIIPTFNNKSYKRSCLPTLLDVMSASASVIEEVIIVDNGSTDGGFSDADFAKVDLNVRLEHFPQPNQRAASRNYGAQLSKAPYLVFVDDDMLLPGRLLSELAGEIHENAFWSCARRLYLPLHIDVELVANAVRNLDLDWLNANSTTTPGGLKYPPLDSPQLQFTYVACFGIVPRSVFDRIGGFAEQFTGWGCEDVELVSRLLADVPLINLFKRYVTFHLDHVVSPYIHMERKRSQEMLWHILKVENRTFKPHHFASDVTQGKDIIKG